MGNDEERWARNISALIDILWKKAGNEGSASSTCIDEIALLDLPCATVKECMQTPEARSALSNLDISQEDQQNLDDILDPDNGGTIGVLDLMDGVARLRGEPRRSDIISVDLMVRVVQQSLSEMHDDIKRLADFRTNGH